MTDTHRPGGRARWIVAAVLAAVAAALAVVTFAVVVPDLHHRQRLAAQVGLSSAEQAAVTAGSQQALNLLTYTRTRFDSDYARAVAGATGALKSDLTNATNKTNLRKQMTTGSFDLQGQVTASAFEEASGANYLVLVSASGYQLPDGKSRTLSSTARFEITMTQVGGKWLAANLTTIGLI